MRSVVKTILIAVGCAVTFTASARDDADKERLANWHQWRGPLATGMSPDGDPPLRWGEKTNVKWKAPLPGKGSSTPIVWGDQVFVLTAIDTGKTADPKDIPMPDPRYAKDKKTQAPKTYHQFIVLSFDRRTGKERWRRGAAEVVPHEGCQPTHTYAASSPTTDGKALYVSFGSRGVFCYDLDGKLKWKQDLGRMETRFGWGEAVSPVVHGDTLIHNWDHEAGSFIVALDARTGETRWKKERDEPSSWSTPLVVEHNGKTQVIVNATNRVRSYDINDGTVLWECGGMTVNTIPSPVARGGVVYCLSGYRGSAALALPLGASGDLTGSDKIVWEGKPGTPYVPSPLLAGDRLYFTQGNNAFFTCLDVKTGKAIIDRQRLPGVSSFYASPVGAGDRIYLTARDGTTLVVRRADRFEVLATNKLDDAIDASPAVVGKQMFLRGEKNLYCIQVP
jgi:outer membrane protein assembly factor BamB